MASQPYYDSATQKIPTREEIRETRRYKQLILQIVHRDILLVDEFLSVRDGEFQKKCVARINEFRNMGSIIVMISHNMDQVARMCQRVVWLNKGKMELEGAPADVIPHYMGSLAQ